MTPPRKFSHTTSASTTSRLTTSTASGRPRTASSWRLALGLRHRLDVVELAAALDELLGRELREVVVVALPRRVGGPSERGLHGRARGGRALQHAERQFQRLPLGLDVEGPAGRVAGWKVA